MVKLEKELLKQIKSEMKYNLLFFSAILLLSCTQVNEKSMTNKKVILENPKVVENADFNDIIGIWEQVEKRKHPKEKGVHDLKGSHPIIFAFNENTKFMTSSLGIDYVKEMYGSLGVKVFIEKGIIKSLEYNKLYENMWGKGIEIYKLENDSLILKYKSYNTSKDGDYFLFKKIN